MNDFPNSNDLNQIPLSQSGILLTEYPPINTNIIDNYVKDKSSNEFNLNEATLFPNQVIENDKNVDLFKSFEGSPNIITTQHSQSLFFPSTIENQNINYSTPISLIDPSLNLTDNAMASDINNIPLGNQIQSTYMPEQTSVITDSFPMEKTQISTISTSFNPKKIEEQNHELFAQYPIIEQPNNSLSSTITLPPIIINKDQNDIQSFDNSNKIEELTKSFFPIESQAQDYQATYSSFNISSTNNETPIKTLPSAVIPFEKSQNYSEYNYSQQYNSEEHNYSQQQLSIDLDKKYNIPKHYRKEVKIVPVEEIEYIPVKKTKYVKKIKVYVPTVKKVIIPVKKKVIIPVKKTIYITKNSNVPKNTLYTLPPVTSKYNNTGDLPYSSTSNALPYSSTSNYQPYTTTSNYQPYTTTSYYQPYTTTSNALPYTTTSNYQPYTTTSNYQPYTTTSNYQPYTTTSNALPYKTTSNYLPYVSSSKYLAEIDNEVESAIPINEKDNSSFPLSSSLNPLKFSITSNNYNRPTSPLRSSIIHSGFLYSPRTYRVSLSARK